jgi:tRNA 2-thiouridine synthesizing protein A
MTSESGANKVTHRLDVLGFHCPVPVAKTREALEKLAAGSVLEVLADDPETLHDMPLLLGRTTHRLVDVREMDGEFAFVIEVVI